MKSTLGGFILFLISVYSIMLILRVILSWIKIPQYPWVYWLCRATDPVIEFFRKNFPIRFGLYDFSIVAPLLILYIIGFLVQDFMITDYPVSAFFNIWYILKLIIIIVKLVFNFILTIYIIFTLILLIFKLISSNSPNIQNPAIDIIYNLLNPILKIAENILKIQSAQRDIIYLIILLVFFILVNAFGSYLLDYLIALFKLNFNEYLKNVQRI